MEKKVENGYDFSCKSEKASLSISSEKRQEKLLVSIDL